MIGAHGLLRIAGSTSAILVGLYLAQLSNAGVALGAGVVGALGAVYFGAELVAAVPLGIASDVWHPRRLLAGGALLGGCATLLFALGHATGTFYVSRTLEGIGAAAIVPALLAYLADVTDGSATLRVRAMSFFELSLLAGLALGGVIAAQLFRVLQAGAFVAVALAYVACAVIFAAAVSPRSTRRIRDPLEDLRVVLALPAFRRLAPVWLSVNAIVGLWLGPVLPYVLTGHTVAGQFLPGLFAHDPSRVGWVLLAYAMIFGAGVTIWSVILPRIALTLAMRVAVAAMLPASAALYVLNHSADHAALVRWLAGGFTAVVVMVESGFTPAALAWLAQNLPVAGGRGAAMGIYSVLLTLGAIVGSIVAGTLGQRAAFDGLLLGTVAIAIVAFIFLAAVSAEPSRARTVP